MFKSRIRVFYAASLIILVVMVIVVLFQPAKADDDYSVVQREHLIKADTEWVLEFDIFNNQDKRLNYRIGVSGKEWEYMEDVSIGAGRLFTFIHHIRRSDVSENRISVTIHIEGESTPFETLTYILD